MKRLFAYRLLFVLLIFVFHVSAELESKASEGPPHRSEAAEEGVCIPTFPLDLPDLKGLIPRYSRVGELHADDLPTMQKRKVIRILTDYSRTDYFLEDGHFFGFEYSLMKEFGRFVNRKLKSEKLRTTIEFIPLPRSVLISALIQGVGDVVAAGMARTRDHRPEVDFTDPYIEHIHHVMVTHSGASPLRDLSALSGRQVYARSAPSDYQALGALNRRLVARGLQPMRIVKAEAILGSEDILEMVNAGIIDLTIAQKHLAGIWHRVLPELRLYEPDSSGPGTDLAWVVRKTNPRLKASLNRFVKGHKKGTLLGNIYFKQYFENDALIKNPLDLQGQERLSRYIPLFRKYGERFEMDWRLLAAVAYQESRLDPQIRSSRGAVGLMQVLPSTARDQRIGVWDLSDVEENVHAGAKYLALLRDEYFSGEELSDEVRVRFALAAYNAGPATIRRCREVAHKMGYNPNRWFHHCEKAAISLHATETVRYVSNVNKYLLAYRLSETLDCLKERLRGRHLKQRPLLFR